MAQGRTFRRLLFLLTIWLAIVVSDVVRTQRPAVAGPVPTNVAPHPAPAQPLPFSHRTHLRTGVQCQACHAGSASGAEMTLPASATCMTCHRSIATTRPAIVKLAEFAQSSQPIPWTRVYQILPGVTWSHRPHLQAGVQCETCHGEVREMDAMAEVTSVTSMAACITCHESRQASTACATCHVWPAN